MDIELIEFRSFYSASTNPPINRDRLFQLKKEWNNQAFLEDDRYENGQHFQQRFLVAQEQFQQIVSLFESLRIQETLFEKLCAPALPPMPPMAGGNSGSSFTVCANGVSVTAKDFSCEGASRICAAMESLKEKCGEPVLDIRPPKTDPPAGCAIGFAPTMNWDLPAPQTPAQPKPSSEDWTCPSCGASENRGNYCFECGMPRSI